MLPEKREHRGIELLVEGDAVEAGRIGAELWPVSRQGRRADHEAKWPAFADTQYSCSAGRFRSTAATLACETPWPPNSDGYSWTGAVTERKLSGVKNTASGSAITARPI